MTSNTGELQTAGLTQGNFVTPRPPLPDNLDLRVLRRFGPQSFEERFRTLQELTAGYEGNLTSVWGTREPLDIPRRVQRSDAQGQDAELDRIVTLVKNARVGSVAIEAAHVYMYEDLDDPKLASSVLTQAEYATRLIKKLNAAGVDTTAMLFVDDYNPPTDGRIVESELDINQLLDLVHSVGYRPEVLLREGAMVPLAKTVMDVLHEQKLAKRTSDSSDEEDSEDPEEASGSADQDSVLVRHNIELHRSKDDMVSCAMLDAALTLIKLEHMGDAVVNVLPRGAEGQGFSYKGQQTKMRTIVGEHLSARVLPVFNLYTGTEPSAPISAGGHHTLRKKISDTEVGRR